MIKWRKIKIHAPNQYDRLLQAFLFPCIVIYSSSSLFSTLLYISYYFVFGKENYQEKCHHIYLFFLFVYFSFDLQTFYSIKHILYDGINLHSCKHCRLQNYLYTESRPYNVERSIFCVYRMQEKVLMVGMICICISTTLQVSNSVWGSIEIITTYSSLKFRPSHLI